MFPGIPSWGSHVNKSFVEVIEAVYKKDSTLLKQISNTQDLVAYNGLSSVSSDKTFFMYPIGPCINFDEYDAEKEFSLMIFDNELKYRL